MARPWLKIHREMLSNPRYGKQPAEVRLAFYELLLLTEDDGTLPDLEQCAWALRWDEDALESAIGTLTSVGWLLDDGDALRWAKWGDYQAESPGAERVRRHRARKRAECSAPVTPVTDPVTPVTPSETREVDLEVDKKRGEEKRGEETTTRARARRTTYNLEGMETGGLPTAEIAAAYHRILPMLPECSEWTTGRRDALLRHFGKTPRKTVDWWEAYFAKVAMSDFLTSGSFKPGIDWLLDYDNAAKVLEGTYDSREQGDDVNWGEA